MSDNWVVQNLENALEVWNGKLGEIWQLITQSPQTFKGGAIWSVVVDIHGALHLLFLLTLALSAMAVQMVVHGKGYQYPGSLIFVVVLYAFYSTTMAIIVLVRFRKLNSPVLSASKVLGRATALVSMLSLQTAMFASFGGDFQFQRLMNALTGGGVCLLILLMAILMTAHANKAIKKPEIHDP